MLLRPHNVFTAIPLRLYHVLIALVLRPHYAYQDLSTLITFSLRPYHELSDCNTILQRFYWDYSTFLSRLNYAHTAILLRSQQSSTSCSISIQFHSFYFWLIRRFRGNNYTVMPLKSIITRGRDSRGWCRGRGSSDSNESWSSRDVGPTNPTQITTYCWSIKLKWRHFSERYI